MAKKLTKKIFINGTLTAVSGLHIGGSNLSMAIGGADTVVIRTALKDNQPYIPGTSLKGKMRSLTERLYGVSTPQDSTVTSGPYQGNADDKEFASHIVCRLYGTVGKEFEKNGEKTKLKNIPSRLLVYDVYLSKKAAQELSASEYTDMPYSEVKTEVVIDRVTSAATPRQIERVPAGAIFEFSMCLNVFEGDNEKELLDHVKVGLRLINDDYLGGKGSRGSGQVKIDLDNLEITYKDFEAYKKGEQRIAYSEK